MASEATDGGPTSGEEDHVSRVGDDPLVLTTGMVAIGLVLGVLVGMMAWTVLAPDDASPETDQVSEELQSLRLNVDGMRTLIDQLDQATASSSWELEATRSRLDGIRTGLDDAEARLTEIGDRLDGNAGSMTGTQEELSALQGELTDVRLDLVMLQGELDDLIDRIIAGEWTGGGGGGGNVTVPENATLLPAPHLTHYESSFLRFSCNICHDVEPAGQVVVSGDKMYWNGSLDEPGFNTVIDLNVECIECHGQFPSAMEPGFINANCIACHEDWADRMTATYVREAAIGEGDCLLCHGGPNAFVDQPQAY